MTKLRLTNSFPHAGQGCVRSFLGCTTFVMQLQLELPDMIWYCMVSYMVLCGIGCYYIAWYCGIVWYCMVLSFLRCTTRICAASAQLIHFQLHLQRERVARRQEHNRVVHFVQLHWLWHWSSDSVCRSFVLQTSRSFVFISVMQAPKVYFWSNIAGTVLITLKCSFSLQYMEQHLPLFLFFLKSTLATFFNSVVGGGAIIRCYLETILGVQRQSPSPRPSFNVRSWVGLGLTKVETINLWSFFWILSLAISWLASPLWFSLVMWNRLEKEPRAA